MSDADGAEKARIRVLINSGGHLVEVETEEPGMTAAKLTEITEGAWERTAPAPGERLGPAIGYTSTLGTDDPFRPRGQRGRRLDEGRPLDAS